ncbi:MAG: CHAT domain-containing protein [Caldilineaceae bacterium]|nr:CHAT domain-containing protein [Caldilineaceae bacterium]
MPHNQPPPASIPEYMDFVLRLQREDDGLRALVVDSPEGQADAWFEAAAFDAAFAELLAAGESAAVGEIEAAVQDLGQALFTRVFAGDVLRLWQAAIIHSGKQGKRLRLRLRLTDVPEVALWPWEILRDPLTEDSLARSRATAVVRHLEAPGAVASLETSGTLTILIVAPAPDDLPALDVAGELTQLTAALASLREAGRVEIDVLDPPTLSALQNRLRKGQVHLLHFIGHGEFDPTSGEGALVFENENGSARRVNERRLGDLLADYGPLRLAVLNACQGAQGDLRYAFSGVAQSLIRRRLPAVLAMAHPITDEAALQFSAEFYAALADYYPVDAALAEARNAVYFAGNPIEWVTPVLYLRSGDGRLFTPPVGMTAPARPAPASLDAITDQRAAQSSIPENGDALPLPTEKYVDWFVNRERTYRGFQKMLAGEVNKRVMLITAPEGMGKTWLIQRMAHESRRRQHGAVVFDFKDAIGRDTLDIVRRARDILGEQHYRPLTQVINEVTGGRVSVHRVQAATDSGAAPVLDRYELIQAENERIKALIDARINDVFFDCVRRQSADRRAVFLFDSLERIQPEARAWIEKELLQRIHDDRLSNVVVVLAGRVDPGFAAALTGSIAATGLSGFEERHIREYIQRRGALSILDKHENFVQFVMDFNAHNKPVMLAELVDGYIDRSAAAADEDWLL